MKLLILMAFGLFLSIFGSDPTSPISPADYQEVIKQGFSTNWFKTAQPASKYNNKDIDDIFSKGFRNVRLRSRADLYLPPYDFTNKHFTWFLGNLTVVVDKCLQANVTPIISWIHHNAEACASKKDRKNYLDWWTTVATHLKDKDYRLSFNLFTELGKDKCGDASGKSLRENTDKYNNWTSEVVSAIRHNTGGKNRKRILILGSPKKTAEDLRKIDKEIYKDDPYMLAEWHIYASGPNKKVGGEKYWSRDDILVGRKNVDEAVKYATDFTNSFGLLTYLGAWMPTDAKNGSLDQAEVINFARYFAGKLKEKKIPWSLNVLDRYYDTENNEWLTELQDVAEVATGTMLNMSKVLDNIIDVM